MIEDKRDILKNNKPFEYKLLKDQKAQIYHEGKAIMILLGKEYAKLLSNIAKNDDYALQLFMAKVTGQFKHGNEKIAKNKYKVR